MSFLLTRNISVEIYNCMELPHQEPIKLLGDVQYIDDTSVESVYVVQSDHPVLEGHFPHVKIWPGVYLIEGMNQCAGYHALKLAEQQVGKVNHEDYVTFVTTVDKCKFRNPVFPGDTLVYHATLIKKRGNHVFYECVVTKNQLKCASATIGLTAKLLD